MYNSFSLILNWRLVTKFFYSLAQLTLTDIMMSLKKLEALTPHVRSCIRMELYIFLIQQLYQIYCYKWPNPSLLLLDYHKKPIFYRPSLTNFIYIWIESNYAPFSFPWLIIKILHIQYVLCTSTVDYNH